MIHNYLYLRNIKLRAPSRCRHHRSPPQLFKIVFVVSTINSISMRSSTAAWMVKRNLSCRQLVINWLICVLGSEGKQLYLNELFYIIFFLKFW